MILFIIEGDAERKILDVFRRFYFDKKLKSNFVYQFCNNIYELYEYMQENEFNSVIMTLKDANANNVKLFEINKDLEDYNEHDFDQIYLFFDYDIQNSNLSIDKMNKQANELLKFFNDETQNGKIYINYPMIESIKCTERLPDLNYKDYRVDIDNCRDFKKWVVDNFTYYKSSDFYLLSSESKDKKSQLSFVRNNWQYLNVQNIKKANYICNNEYKIPDSKSNISQINVFNIEKELALTSRYISIINSFPLFMFEYFKNPEFLYKKC